MIKRLMRDVVAAAVTVAALGFLSYLLVAVLLASDKLLQHLCFL
jgi:hypothetical protein